MLSPEQRHALVGFRQERLRIRKDLREVRRQLRKDIERLETGLKFANIALMPLLIGIGGIGVGLWRVNRRRPSLGPA